MMKKLRIPVLLLAVSLLLGSAAMAAGNLMRAGVPAVVYDGSTGNFALENVKAATDLFPNFKNIMPGDERTQNITLVTKNITSPVAIYLTSKPDEASKKALDPLTISVSRDGEPVDGNFAHSIQEGVPLGVFQKGDNISTVLQVTLTVPPGVGNELQEARASLQWEFIAQPNEIVITPVDITSYVGGESFSDSDEDDDHISKSGVPTLRFHVTLPNDLDLADGQSVTMTLHQNGENVTMTPKKVTGSNNLYCFPTLERGLKFVDGNEVLKGDYLTLKDTSSNLNSQGGFYGSSYAVRLVTEPAWYITAEDASGWEYTVKVDPGDAKVYVRYVSDGAGMIDDPRSVLTEVVSDPANVDTIVDVGGGVIYRKAVAVIPKVDENDEKTVFYTNGKSAGLGSFTLDDVHPISGLKPRVALLFDDTVSLTDKLTDDAIEKKMIEHANHAKSCGAGAAADYSFADWDFYDFHYLDLVNFHDGNAWVSTDAETTIYWPYPEEVLANPGAYEYQILHYQRMSRDFTRKALENIDTWEAELLHNGDKGPVKVVSEELELTDKGLRFVLEEVEGSEDNFSPFVLMWRKKGSTGSDTPSDPPSPPSGKPADTPAPAPGGPAAEPGPDGPGTPSPSDGQQPAGPSGPESAAPPRKPTLPQTGQNWRPVLLTAAAGVLLLALGLGMGKTDRKKDET